MRLDQPSVKKDNSPRFNPATDVIGVLNELGVDRFRLLGHDWGGLVSYLIALREPPRVERLVVGCTEELLPQETPLDSADINVFKPGDTAGA